LRTIVVRAIGARAALALAVPAAMVVVSGASALAAAGPAAAAARGAAAPSCTVNWVGRDFPPMWTDPKNWSTGKVPGPADDVCITNTGDDVLTSISIDVHSLLLGPVAGIAMEGTPSNPLTATVATSVTMTPGAASRIDLTDASINAAQIDDQGGTIFTDGPCNLTSPDVVFGAGGSLQAANGTTTLSSLPQLSNGTLTGATIDTALATVVLPSDISHLVNANIGVGAKSEIRDAAGHNALTGLTSIDMQSSLLLAGSLTLPGSLTASGNVNLEGAHLTLGGTFTQAQGTLSIANSTVTTSQVTIGAGGTLFDLYGGGSTIAGNLVNDGSVEAGHLQVTGNYTQAPGASLGVGFGVLLAVKGQATLAGSVSAAELFSDPGDTAALITFGSLSGGFTSHSVGIVLTTKPHEIDATITPQIAATPATVAPGQTVTVDGGGFQNSERVRIFLHSVTGRPLATAIAGIRGQFAATFTVPSFTATGTQQIIAVGGLGDQATTTITVG
jgi:hypothetical protein